MATFVLVHGAWHGAWCWRRVARMLTQAGHEVFTPTLTGVGERSHLLKLDINLDTHILDVVNEMRWQELNNVVLVGYSYAGMVVTGVAEKMEKSIASIVIRRALLRMGRAMIDLYCELFTQIPKRITLDIDDMFDAVHGGQQLRLFNAHYDEYGFQPIVVFDGAGRFVTTVLRPARRPGGKEIRALLRRLLRTIRSHWPKTEILLRGDSHYCTPETIDFCRANGLDFIFGVALTSTLRAHILALEAKATAMFEAAPKNGKVRRFKEFFDGAQSWSRVERIVARVEAGADGPDTRFVVTNLTTRNARRLYEDVYCRRGQAENHIKSWKTHLAADRTSCMKASANQLRLFLHAGAYWLMRGLRQSMPRRSMWRVAQFDTLRLRLIKIAARVVEMKTMIRVHLPTSCCGQDI